MESSKPNDPRVDQGQPIPRSRRPGDDEVLEGEIIDRGVPIGRPRTGPLPPPTSRSGHVADKKPTSARRTVLLVLVGVAALICLGGSLTFYIWYDKTTTPERGTPAVAVEQYITAKFVTRDEPRARLFVCDSPQLASVDDLLNQIRVREADTKVGIHVTISDLSVDERYASATVLANLNIGAMQANGANSVVKQRWQFGLLETSGWRVCTATKLS